MIIRYDAEFDDYVVYDTEAQVVIRTFKDPNEARMFAASWKAESAGTWRR